MSKIRERLYMALTLFMFFVAMAFTGTIDYQDAKFAEQHQLTAAQKRAVIACWKE